MSCCPVSVVIPTYNRADYLVRAIASVRRQTLRCSEIVVVDDGSTDNTSMVLDKLRQENSIPMVVIQTPNRGVAAARNTGIQNANFEWLAFLDSDDHWHKRKIEKQFAALSETDEFMISHTREKWLRRGQHLNQKKIHIPRHGDIFSHCLLLCAVGMSTVMVKKNLFDTVGMFDERLQCCEDYDLWLRVSCRYPFLLIDEPLTVKEGGRNDQLSFIHRLGMDEKRIYSLEKILSGQLLDENQYFLAVDAIKQKISIFAQGCIKHGRVNTGRRYLKLLDDYCE